MAAEPNVSKTDLATYLGVHLTSITTWVRNGCPYVVKGSVNKPWVFNTADVIDWRQDRAVQKALGDTKLLDIDEGRRRKVAAEAGLAELELAQKQGEVVEIDSICAAVADDYSNVRAKLLSLPTKLAPQVAVYDDTAECLALLSRGIDEALEELTVDGIYQKAENETDANEAGESEAAA